MLSHRVANSLERGPFHEEHHHDDVESIWSASLWMKNGILGLRGQYGLEDAPITIIGGDSCPNWLCSSKAELPILMQFIPNRAGAVYPVETAITPFARQHQSLICLMSWDGDYDG